MAPSIVLTAFFLLSIQPPNVQTERAVTKFPGKWFSNPFRKWGCAGSKTCKKAELPWQKQTGQEEGLNPDCSFYFWMAWGLSKMGYNLETWDLAQNLHCSTLKTEIKEWKWLVGVHMGKVETSLESPVLILIPPLLIFQASPGFFSTFYSLFHCFRSFLSPLPQDPASLPHLLQESPFRLLKSTDILSPEVSISMPPNIASNCLLIVLTYDCQVCEHMWVLPSP